MHTRFLSLLLLASTVAAQGQLIYDNGGLVTNPGAGSGGGDVSALQGNANSFGLNASVAGSFRIADDVATNGAWIVDGFEFFLYQTGTLIPSINDIRVEIYDDSPATGGLPIVGSPGITNNLFATAGYTATTTFTNIYRTTSTTFADVNRRIQSVRINLTTPLILDSQGLNAGRAYWFEIQAAGTMRWPCSTAVSPSG